VVFSKNFGVVSVKIWGGVGVVWGGAGKLSAWNFFKNKF
jgi:hypothetical protein